MVIGPWRKGPWGETKRLSPWALRRLREYGIRVIAALSGECGAPRRWVAGVEHRAAVWSLWKIAKAAKATGGKAGQPVTAVAHLQRSSPGSRMKGTAERSSGGSWRWWTMPYPATNAVSNLMEGQGPMLDASTSPTLIEGAIIGAVTAFEWGDGRTGVVGAAEHYQQCSTQPPGHHRPTTTPAKAAKAAAAASITIAQIPKITPPNACRRSVGDRFR